MRRLLFIILTGFIYSISTAQTSAADWYTQGINFKQEKDYDKAIDAFKKAVVLNDKYGTAWHQLAWCYNEKKMYNDALAALKNEMAAGSEDKVNCNFEMGYAYYGLQQYDHALAFYNNALTLDNNFADGYKERGNVFYKKGVYQNALDDYNKYAALKDNIADEVFYFRKGWCENELKQYEEAVRSLKKAVALNTTDAQATSELGYAFYKLNRNDEAIGSYRNAISLDSKDHLPLFGLADTYFDNLKNYDSAMMYYEKGIQLNKKSKSAFYHLGWCYNDKNRFAEAVSPLQQAIMLDAEYDIARIELGYAYYKLARYDDALEQFRTIIRKDDRNELSRYYAGFCYYLKEDQNNLKAMIAELKNINTPSSLKYVETLAKYVK